MEEKNGKLSVVTAPEKDGKSEGKKSFWHINKELLPFKMHFFLFIGGMGATLPYYSAVGITKLGFTASNLAVSFTAQQFLFLFLKPGVGYLADYFNRLKATLVGLTVLQAIFCFCIVTIPSAGLVEEMNEAFQSESINANYHHLCNHTDEFKNVSFNQPLAEDVLGQILSCVKYFEMYESKYDAIHCSKENQDFLYSMNVSYRILTMSCNDSLGRNLISPTEHAVEHSLYSGDVLLLVQSFDGLKSFPIVCLPPKDKNLFAGSFSGSHMKEHCHPFPDSAGLQELLLSTLYNTTHYHNNKPDIHAIGNYDHSPALSDANFRTYQFWVFTVCLILCTACCSCIFTISDTACYESIRGADYGRQRAWGAVSWGVIAPLAGFLNDYTEDYLSSSFLMMFLCSLQIWNLSKMNLVKPDFSQSILGDLKAVFSSMEFLAFETGVFLNGMFTGVIWFYMTWYLTTIGGNRLVIGLAHTVQCFLGELPIMFVSGWMIKKFGHFNLVSLALLCHGIRFFIYSYLHNPWFVLPIECLHGFTFGSFYTAMTSYGKLNSKPGTEATTQSVLCTTYEALGAGLGCAIFGVFFDYYGCHTTFFYGSFVCAAATVLNVLFSVLIGCRKGELDVTKKADSNDERY